MLYNKSIEIGVLGEVEIRRRDQETREEKNQQWGREIGLEG